MAKFNSSQINYLVQVQSIDDWHPQGLIHEIDKRKDLFTGLQEDFADLQSKLSSLSIGEIEHLQLALNHLGAINLEFV